MEEYLYYIFKNPYIDVNQSNNQLPVIGMLKKDSLNYSINLLNKDEGEGPFTSLIDLKQKSLIFSGIKLQKHKQRVLKSANIQVIEDLIITNTDFSCEKNFFDSFAHITVGKISKEKLQGVHFYDPELIKIIEMTFKDDQTGVFEAKIRKLDKKTGKWFEKEELTNFFPDNWTINKLFHECYFAYTNRKRERGKTFYGNTKSGILVKFFIDIDNRILTFYPELKK